MTVTQFIDNYNIRGAVAIQHGLHPLGFREFEIFGLPPLDEEETEEQKNETSSSEPRELKLCRIKLEDMGQHVDMWRAAQVVVVDLTWETPIVLESMLEEMSGVPGWVVRVVENTTAVVENTIRKELSISHTGAWTDMNMNEHAFDNDLATAVLCAMKLLGGGPRILDLGCGPGEYVLFFRSHGYECRGFDGNPNTPEMSKGLCEVLDLTVPGCVPVKYDTTICLEVGEHIPADRRDVFLDNLCGSAEGLIVLSWGVPGQGGYGHVGCLENREVEDMMRVRGWRRIHTELETLLRLSASCSWFRNTVMIFDR